MSFDIVIIAALAIFSIIGYFKGFLSQFFSFVGIVAAYLLSPKWSPPLEEIMRDLLPFSYVVADMFARLLVGIVIFIAVKIAGKFIEFIFGTKTREFTSFNRWGGFFFGLLKATLAIFIVMAFVTLIPKKIIKKRFPVLKNSNFFKISRKYNPVINPAMMERVRKLRALAKNPSKIELISKSVVFQDYLKTKGIDNPLKNKNFMEDFRNGDVKGIKKKKLDNLIEDKDFMDFVYGEKYYGKTPKAESEQPPEPKTNKGN